MNLTEADVKKQIKDCLNAVGALPVSIWQGLMSSKGVSDILVCYRGKFMAIEVKKSNWQPPGRGTKAYKHYWQQFEFLEKVRQAGGIGFFATDVETVIKEMDLKAEVYPLFNQPKGKEVEMTTLQCQKCKKSIKDVTTGRAYAWYDSHKCEKTGHEQKTQSPKSPSQSPKKEP